MSGPKVVRIVTREEIIALCQRQLARLDAHIESWTSTGRRHGVVSEAEAEEMEIIGEVIDLELEEEEEAEPPIVYGND